MSVFVFGEGTRDIANTSIRIGTNSDVSLNPICKTINVSELWTCDSPLTGNFLGLRREVDSDGYFGGFTEVRAYPTTPFFITTDMLSDTSGIANSSLGNSLGLASYAVMSNGRYQVNLGSIKKVKALLVLCGGPATVTFGNSPDP